MAIETRTPGPRHPAEPITGAPTTDTPLVNDVAARRGVDEATSLIPLWSRASGNLRLSLRPAPRVRQLVSVCAWAALLGCVGLAIGLRALFGVLADTPPGWYEPTIILVGLVGLVLTVSAFVTIQRRATPFALLSGATAALVSSLAITVNAF